MDLTRSEADCEERIETYHGAEEGHCAAKKGDLVRIGPGFNSARNLDVGGPEER